MAESGGDKPGAAEPNDRAGGKRATKAGGGARADDSSARGDAGDPASQASGTVGQPEDGEAKLDPAEGPVGQNGWGESADDAASWGGTTADYPDLVAVEPVLSSESVDVTFTFAGDLPEIMPDPNTVMDVRFGMKREGSAPARSFGLRAGVAGWYLDTAHGSWDGSFDIEGDKLLLRIALHELGERSVVRWVATSQWAHRPVKGTTAYMVDTVPNQKPGRLDL